MKFSDFRIASFAGRLLALLALTLVLVFSVHLLLHTPHLRKLTGESEFRWLLALSGGSFSIFSANYFMGLRGRNFTEWRIELLIVFNFVLFFLAFTLPWMFPDTSSTSWWPLVGPKTVEIDANLHLLLIITLIEIPLFLLTCGRVAQFLRRSKS